MKKTLLVSFILALAGCTHVHHVHSTNDKVIERSIGKLLLYHDKKRSYSEDLNPFGGGKIYSEFVQIYNEEIKGLPEEERIKFFWAGMWHLGFDGHVMAEFQMLIINDCGDSFIEKLEKYVSIESELKRNRTRLYLSERVLARLKSLRERQKKR